MVEPTDGAEVESGELRWPPDEPSPPDEIQTGRRGAEEEEEEAAGEEPVCEVSPQVCLLWSAATGKVGLG